MNLIRIGRFLFLSLFMLLQCVTPLAHAHIDGKNADHHAHLGGAELAWLSDHDHQAVEHHEAGELHASVVCAQPESRCSGLSIDQPMLDSSRGLIVQDQFGPYLYYFRLQPPSILPAFQHPLSQAPPA